MHATDFMPTAHLRLMDKDLAFQRHLEKIKEKQTQHIKKLSQDPKTNILLKSYTSQLYVTTSLQIELIDNLRELGLSMAFSSLFNFQKEMEELNTSLYHIAIQKEEDDVNRLEWEQMMLNIVDNISNLNRKQLILLNEFSNNLKEKK
jgi:hypothetical protein